MHYVTLDTASLWPIHYINKPCRTVSFKCIE